MLNKSTLFSSRHSTLLISSTFWLFLFAVARCCVVNSMTLECLVGTARREVFGLPIFLLNNRPNEHSSNSIFVVSFPFSPCTRLHIFFINFINTFVNERAPFRRARSLGEFENRVNFHPQIVVVCFSVLFVLCQV